MPYQSPLGQGLDGIREAIAGYMQMSQQRLALKRQALLDQQAQQHQTTMEGFERQQVAQGQSRLDLEAQRAKQDARTSEQKFISGIIDDNPDAIIDQPTGKHYQEMGFGPSLRQNMSLPSSTISMPPGGDGPLPNMGGSVPNQGMAPQDMGGFRINPTSSERLRAQLANAQARASEGELNRAGQNARAQAQISQQMAALKQSGELARAAQMLTARGISNAEQRLELDMARALEDAMNDQGRLALDTYGRVNDPNRILANVMAGYMGSAAGQAPQPPIPPNLTNPLQGIGKPNPPSTPSGRYIFPR